MDRPDNINCLGRMNTNQVKELSQKTSIALLPMGPTEVHSQHLPLFTDIESALEACERVAMKLLNQGRECLIAPPINYCLADSANCFAGNTTLRPETVTAIVSDVVNSLSRSGFHHVIVICGHGEPANTVAVQEGCEDARRRSPHTRVLMSNWLHGGFDIAHKICFSCEHPEWDIHAGEHETSFMLMRHPELVDRVALSKLEPNWAAEHFFERTGSFIELGAPLAYLGDPQKGNAQEGEVMYDIATDYILEEISALLKAD